MDESTSLILELVHIWIKIFKFKFVVGTYSKINNFSKILKEATIFKRLFYIL